MHILASSIGGVEIISAEGVAFDRPMVPEALPYTVAIRNLSMQTIALVGVRFDIKGPRGRKYSVVHYADMLRDPARAELRPGCVRAICAEPSYTAHSPGERGQMNLQNLARMLRIDASIDCVAFDDGRFEGPDSLGALTRLNEGREAEADLVSEILAAEDTEGLLTGITAEAKGSPARTALARKFLTGDEPIRNAAIAHRLRISLWRA